MNVRIAMLIVILGALGGFPLNAQQQPQAVSIIQLIANPSVFDGKLIRVTGFLRLEFENTALYLHKEDSDHALYLNGVWVTLPLGTKQGETLLDKHYVLIEGVFDAKNRGHMGMSSGAITKIQRVELRPAPGV